MVPATAKAAEGTAATTTLIYAVLAALVTVAVVFAAMWWRAAARLVATRIKANALADQLKGLAGAAGIGSDGYLIWQADGTVNAAGVLAGAECGNELEPLQDILAPGQAEILETAVANLRSNGNAFEIELKAAGGSGRWRARGGTAGGVDAQVLWLDDVSRLRQRIAKAEGRARDAEAGLAALQTYLDRLTTPLYERDSRHNIIWCNRAYARLVNVEQDRIADGSGEIETALTRGSGSKLAARAADAGEPASEVRHFVVEGQRRALEVTEMPGLPNGHGAGAVRDVTDLEEREAELRRHIDAHVEVLNNLSTAIAIFDANRHLSYFNNAYVNLWRLDEDWLETRPLHGEILDRLRESRLLPEVPDFPAYRKEQDRFFTDLLETEEEIIYLPSSRVLRRIVSPHPLGGISVLDEDITDSLALERSFNTLIAVQQETLDNLHEGIAVYGSDGRLKLYNPAFSRIWHLNPDFLSEEPHVGDVVDAVRDLLSSHSQDGDWEGLRQRLITQATSRESRMGRMEHPDGSIIDFASVALPDGNMLFTYVDVTDSVNVERALRERNQALETADRLKSEFLASVSYELRTPLNVIIGFAEVLVNEYFGALNERQMEYGRDILNSSQQLLALINNILDLASIEAGRLELEITTIDIGHMLENVQSLARERAQRRQITLELDCTPDIGIIEADEKRIKQALFNLVTNSLKYTPSGGHVTLGANRYDDGVELYVVDDGSGIHEADHTLIFESFQRGRFGNAEHSAGLGLSLVKRFTELHGGRIGIDSRLGEGTRISLYLPLRPDAQPGLSLVAGAPLQAAPAD